MRLYSFVNYYLSDIQRGIQTAHVVQELNNKYNNKFHEGLQSKTLLHEWGNYHKTIIVLNGKNSANLRNILSVCDSVGFKYPYAHFNEDEQSLDCALTCVGIVVPEHIIEMASSIKTTTYVGANEMDIQLATFISNHNLA